MEKTIALNDQQVDKRARRIGFLKKYGIVALFLLPFLAAFITFFVLPLIYGVYISLTNFKYGAPGEEVFNQARWYTLIFTKEMPLLHQAFWASFLHSVVFSVIMVPVAVLLPLALAILVNKKPPAFKLFRSLIYLPSIVPLTAAGTIFTMMFMTKSEHGLLAEMFGVDIKWFIDSWFKFTIGNTTFDVAYAWIPIFLMCLWGGWGSNFIILSAGLENIPKNLYEASDIDGCSAWKKILHITIPGIKGQLVLCLFTTIIGYLGLYGQNYVLSNGGPMISTLNGLPAGGKTSTIMYFIQDIVANVPNFRSAFYGLGAAASLVFALFVGIVSGIQMYCTRERKTGTKISEAYEKWHKIK